eukprot:TRINITY_DN16891_c0_g1_i1.p1 TRINITY_DN16891_c0_g1~~TRINITY_DN16891_c0_g1_i1.p1  ORF type:complete len:364 (+),score=70.18 TRINITY_DN16891_c0_g1_i1:41-1093(+)
MASPAPAGEMAKWKEATNLVTLTRHLIADQRAFPQAQGHLTLLLNSIQLGCKFVASAVSKAGIAKTTGIAGGDQNATGDTQKKLDVIANEVFINALRTSGEVTVMASEENDDIIVVDNPAFHGPYAVCFDPLDGSSNIDAGVSIGSIFAIFKIQPEHKTHLSAVLRKGTDVVAAGYCMYGSSTVMVISTGQGVNGFTLDPSLGEFILTHEQIRIPERANIYSINEGNSLYWDKPTAEYVARVKSKTAPGGKPYSARYIGSMVADVHRTLLYGGIFMYPGDSKSPKGKLRILYECFPMAFILEKAGGKASTGKGRILEVIPKDIHDRCPVFLGSKLDVEEIEELYRRVPHL